MLTSKKNTNNKQKWKDAININKERYGQNKQSNGKGGRVRQHINCPARQYSVSQA